MAPLSSIRSSQKRNFTLPVAVLYFSYIKHCQQYICFQSSLEFNWDTVVTVLLALGHIFRWFHYFIAFIISGTVIGHKVPYHYPSASRLRQRFKYHCISSKSTEQCNWNQQKALRAFQPVFCWTDCHLLKLGMKNGLSNDIELVSVFAAKYLAEL